MDMRDKQFDSWMKDTLNTEIPLSKQNRQAAWDKICVATAQPTLVTSFVVEQEYVRITSPQVVRESFYTQIRQWFDYFVNHETTYHKARIHSAQHYKAKVCYNGGLTICTFELLRHRWACAI